MDPAQIFSLRNSIVSLAIIVVCGIAIKIGISHENRINAARLDNSNWSSLPLDTRWKLDAALLTSYRKLHDQKNRNLPEATALVEAQIGELKVRSSDDGTINSMLKISDSRTEVHEAYMKYSKKLSELPLSTSKARIFLWFLLGASALFFVLSSLRFALLPTRSS
jgi:hypothetical protein